MSKVTVRLALFDNEVPNPEKRKMVHHMATVDGIEEPSPRLQYSSGNVVKKGLPEFFTVATKSLLHNLEIDFLFLDSDPEPWANTEAYVQGKARISMQMMTNDAAEHSVALIRSFTTMAGQNKKISSRSWSK